MNSKQKFLGALGLAAAGVLFVPSAMATVIYSEDFESGAPGFTFNSYWHVTGNAPYAGTYALGFVKDETAGPTPNGSYADTGGSEQTAFSPLISLGNDSSIVLSFAARVDDEFDDAPDIYDRLSVGVSLDGSTFDSVLASSNPGNGGVNIPENVGYNLFNVDLTPYAGQDIYLAFSFTTFDNIDDDHPGPRIDNLLISSEVPEPASLALLGVGLAGVGAMRRKTRR